jgi:hypothetical protein
MAVAFLTLSYPIGGSHIPAFTIAMVNGGVKWEKNVFE